MEKKIFTTMAAALMSAAALAQAPAFPGAEGHGRYVTGGRGGRVGKKFSRKSYFCSYLTQPLRNAV